MVEVALLRGLYRDDRPWERLRWIFPAVVLGWAVLLWALGFLLERHSPLPPPKPIDATVIELPAQPARPEARKAEPRPAPQPVIRPEPAKSIEPEPAPVPAPDALPPPVSTPVTRPQRPVETGRAAARVLYRPLPKIPDELRDQAINMEALARFDVGPDGTATVVLVQPTPNPALNRIILDALRTWRFFPAMEGGRPVASTQEVRVRLEVR